MQSKYTVDADEKDHIFVNGNTKFLKKASQKDLETLFKNGDKRVKVEAIEEESVANEASANVEPPAPTETEPAANDKKSGRRQTAA